MMQSFTKMPVSAKQQGFTLIELVMVIVILGILAAFALPRFADLGNEARAASLQGAFGAVKSASAIAHSAFLAAGNNPATVDLEGTMVAIVNGYPAATQAGILDAAQITATDFNITAGAPILVQAKGAATPANCQISYTAAAAGGSPTITIVATGC